MPVESGRPNVQPPPRLPADVPARLAVQFVAWSAVGFACWFECWTAPTAAVPTITASRPVRTMLIRVHPR
ncbi:hypothetical protein [Streptosporangium sp. NPDC051022]|uniref:hypothetical protein n=1 Tax=Streptosporangium sp. NPDC051022 TaxID=3155752 RepID=UPI0034499B39